MKKNKNIIITAIFFLAISWFLSTEKALAEGIWTNFSIMDKTTECTNGWNYACAVLKKTEIFNNINFPSSGADSINVLFPDRRNPSTPHKYSELNFKADFYVPTAGDYVFYVEDVGATGASLSTQGRNYMRTGAGQLLCNKNSNLECPTEEFSSSDPLYDDTRVILAQGWQSFDFTIRIPNTVETPRLTLRWAKWKSRGATYTYEFIPDEYFNWKINSTNELTIPEGKKRKISFYTSGVAVGEYLNNDKDPKITLKIPEGRLNEDFSDIYDTSSLTDGSYVFWYDNSKDENPKITIRNTAIAGSPDANLTGTRLKTDTGVSLGGAYAKIPSDLVRFNATRDMEFVFEKLSKSKNGDGIGIILPYIDESLTKGTKLKLKFPFASTYHGTFSPVNFDLDSSLDNATLQPVFFFPDGETKYYKDTAGKTPRPNFMSMLLGTESKPNSTSILFKDYPADTKRIFPKEGATGLDLNDTTTWYPAFGREGANFDVLSSLGNYLPNKESSYRNSDGDGVIDVIEAKNKNWISFQWYSSNFGSDGVTDNPESGGLSVIGLLGAAKNSKLAICGGLPITINKGDYVSFKAYFWDNYTGTEEQPPCDEASINAAIAAGEEVKEITNDPNTFWSPSDSSVLTLASESGNKGRFFGFDGGVAKAQASYHHTEWNEDFEDSVSVTVAETETKSCPFLTCDKSTSYICESRNQTIIGSICPPSTFSPANCTTLGETCRPELWKEIAP